MRGHGIGGQLLAALVEQAGEDGYPALSLSVERGNPAISLYERHGFRPLREAATPSSCAPVLAAG